MFPIQNVLVSCGLLVGPLCIATDILAATLFYPGYDYTSQQVSELSAIGAPSRSFWLLMSGVLALTTAGFGIGVWRAAGARLLIRIAGIAIVVFTIYGLLWVLFAPMHMRATTFTATDIAHIVFTVAAVLIMLCFISCGAIALGSAFQLCSALTLLAMLSAGGIVGTQISAIVAGAPTPFMGLVERIGVYGPMIWMLVFSILLQRLTARPPDQSPAGRRP